MRRVALLAILATGLALPAPSAFAHGNQFICARLTIGDDGRVTLELTADHGDNPNIADVGEARQVLGECLQIEVDGRRFPLGQLAPLHFSERTQYGADSPVPPSAEAGPHRLVSASWRADLPGSRIAFAAKQRTPLDVVMWRGDLPAESGSSRWMLLIAGDRSPEFVVTATATMHSTRWWLAALAVLGLLPLGWHLLRRPQVRNAEPTPIRCS